jgi:predicted nucleotidyltransferase
MNNNIIKQLKKENKISIPNHLIDNIQYLVYGGSTAYGVSNNESDIDIYGFTIPTKEDIYPYLHNNYIYGFDDPPNVFTHFTQHNIDDKYDITIYSIIKFFYLLMKNNPMALESLYVKEDKIIYMTEIGKLIRDSRHIFISKGFIHSFAGFAYSQLHKMQTKNPIGSRKHKLINGIDYKFAYHAVRLLLEMEQLLLTNDMDLEKDAQLLYDIRKGIYTPKWLIDYCESKINYLKEYNSSLQHSPNRTEIKALLLNCLHIHNKNIYPKKIPNELLVIKDRNII